MKHRKLWSKDFIIIFFANFFVALTFYLLMTTLAMYAVEHFAASESEAGLAASIFVIGALFSRLLAGKYIEVVGRKKMLYGGLILFFVAVLLYFFTNSLTVLMIVRFIHGAAFGVASTGISTTVMDMIPYDKKGEGTSYFSLSTVLATAIGPFLGLYLTQNFEFNIIFVTCTIFSIVTLVITLFAKVQDAELTEEMLEQMKKGFRFQDFFEKKALPISILMIFMGIAYSSIISFINVYAVEIRLEKAASLFFVIYAIVLLVSRPLTGKLLDLKGDNIVIYPALALFAFSLFLLSQAHHGVVILFAGAFVALGYGTIMSSAQAIAVKESPNHRVGLATSTFFIFMDGGVGIGPYLIGLMIPYTGFRDMYMILSVCILLTIALYYFLHGKRATVKRRSIQEVS